MSSPAETNPTYPSWAVPAEPVCTFADPCGDCVDCFEANPIVIDLSKVAEVRRGDRLATNWGN